MLDSGGGGGGSQRTSSDGLILPSAFPAREHDLDTSKINGSANDLRAMGKSVRAQMGDIDSEWSGLRDHYEAPEQGRVYKLMDPAVESATDLKSTLRKAAGHLDTYASSLECIKPRLKDIEKRAWDFRNKVQGGVEVEQPTTSRVYGARIDPGSDGGDDTKTIPWNEDEDTVAKNEALLKEYAGLLEEISNAASTCANDINALVEGKCVAKVETTPAEAFTNPQKPMPWGSPVAEDKTCGEQVGDAGKGWGKALAEGVGQSVLGYNPGSNPWDRDSYTLKSAGQAWGGFGDLIRSTVVVPAAGYTQLGYKLTGHDDDEMPEWTTSKWMNDRADVMASGWGGMVGYDHEAAKAGDSGWQKWKDNPWEAGTETALNIGTAFIPGAGTAGAGAKAASTGGKVAKASKAGRVANGVADFVVPGGSWALKGGVTVGSKFKDLAAGMTPSAMKTFGKGDASPHKDLIDAVDDVPAKAPERSTPVSDTTFGGDRTPAGEPGPSPSSSPVAPDGQPSSGVPESSGAGRAEGAEPGQPVGRDGVAEPGSGTGKTTAAGDRSPAPVESPEARDAASTGAPAARAGADGSGSAGAPESPVPARADGGESPAPAGRDGVGGSGPGASPAAGAGAAGRGVPEQPVASGAADRAPAGGERPSGDGAESPASAGRDGAGRSGPGASPASGVGAAGRGLPEQPVASGAVDRAPAGGERPSGDGPSEGGAQRRGSSQRPGRPMVGDDAPTGATDSPGAGRDTPTSDTPVGERPSQTPDADGTPSDPTRSEPGSTEPDAQRRPDSPVADAENRPGGTDPRPLPDRAGWDGMSPAQVSERVADIAEGRSTVSVDDVRAMPDSVRTQVLDSIDARHGRPDGEQGMQDLRSEMRDPDSPVGEKLREAADKSSAKNPEWTDVDPDAPSESGLTNSGRLVDGKVPAELQSLVDDGVVRVDNGVLRLAEPVRIEFDTPALQANPVEAQRQLSQQARGLSELNGGRWFENFDAHEPGATRVDPPMHGAVRDQLKELRVGQLEDLGFERGAAEQLVAKEYANKQLLHSPDGVAGGNVFGYTGMGDGSVNGAIGRGWVGRRRSKLGDGLTEQLMKIPEEFWGDVRLDVDLVLLR